MDKKTFEYMDERVKSFKSVETKIKVIDSRIEFYRHKDCKKYFGQTNNYIGADNLGNRITNKLVEVTIKCLTEEKELLMDELNKI